MFCGMCGTYDKEQKKHFTCKKCEEEYKEVKFSLDVPMEKLLDGLGEIGYSIEPGARLVAYSSDSFKITYTKLRKNLSPEERVEVNEDGTCHLTLEFYNRRTMKIR